MASYQDIDVRLSVVEDKIDLVMKSFSITKRYQSSLVPGQFVEEKKSLLELYREIKGLGVMMMSPEEMRKEEAKKILEGEVVSHGAA